MPDKFYTALLLRHFPTKKNEGGKTRERLRGWLNEPIDPEIAAELAPKVARILDKQGIDCLYASPLTRGRQTAEAVAAAMGASRTGAGKRPEIEIRAGFKSWDTGKYTGELRDKVWPTIERYIRNPEEKIPGDERFDGEKFGEIDGERGGFIPRWRDEVKYQLKDAKKNDGKNAWILHGNMLWTLDPLLEGRQPTIDDWKEQYDAASPGSILKLEFNDDDFRITPIFDSGKDGAGHLS